MPFRRRIAVLACASLFTSSGCGLILRAARGELTPVGVDAIDAGGIGERQRVLAESDDSAEVARAFTDLTSAYLYKCMENPTKAPQQGDQDLRLRAGQALLAGMQHRVAAKPMTGDVAIDDQVAALRKDMAKKCSGDKGVGKHDADGLFAQAAEIAAAKGRAAYVQRTATTLEPALAQAIAKDELDVRRWVDDCGRTLPKWEYCAPRAAEATVQSKKLDTLLVALVGGSDPHAETLLVDVARRIGEKELVDTLREYMLGGAAPLPGVPEALDRAVAYLQQHQAWGGCEDHDAMWKRTIASGDGVAASWALASIVTDRCRNADELIVTALGSDKPQVREQAVWAVGELELQKAKKHIERLQWTDPYLDQGCWCHPVRDAARQAFNKLELAG